MPDRKELKKNEGNFIYDELSDSYSIADPLTLLVINRSVKGVKKGQ